jgi:hypothetical protein
VQGAEKPTIIDQGDISITTQRVVFRGGKYTREWLISKLLGLMHDAHDPWTAIQVSNREKTSGIVYSGLAPDPVRLRLAVAVAIFNGEAQQVAQELRDEMASPVGAPTSAAPSLPSSTTTMKDAHPQPPVSAAPAPPPPENLPPPPKPMWAVDPSGHHQYRWFDGKIWTDIVGDNGQQSRDPLPPKH